MTLPSNVSEVVPARNDVIDVSSMLSDPILLTIASFSRKSKKEYLHFLNIALGSCSELETQIILSYKRGYLEKDVFDILSDKVDHEMRMLSSLMAKINRSS